MKKIFAYILITLILITPFFTTHQTAHALPTFEDVGTVGGAVIGGPAGAAIGGATGAAIDEVPAAIVEGTAGEVAAWFKGIVAWIAYAALFQSAALAGIAGVLLEEAIQFSVVTMSTTIDSYPAINYGWSLVRDLGNFIFIFALLYVAFTTIFGMADGNTMKLIRNIIIVGLLVNFSLFFTKILIDASNILSLVFYSQFATAGAATGSGALDAAVDTITMTEKLASFLKIQSLFNADTAQKTLVNNDWIPLLTLGIGGTIFFLSTAFSFLYAALLFLLRFLMLIILLILSPIGFLGYMLPATSGLAKKWWNLLVAQLAFAPLYMLLISVVFLLAGGMDKIYPAGTGGLDGVLKTVSGAGEGGAQLSSATDDVLTEGTGYSKVIGPIVNFIVIIGLINAAAIIATVVATNTSGFAKGMGDRSRVWLGRSTFGVAGAAGRNTIGRVGSMARDKDTRLGGFLGRTAASGNLVTRTLARSGMSLGEKASKASFDARNNASVAALGLGTAEKRGYDQVLDDKAKKAEERVKASGGSSSATLRTIRTAQADMNTARQRFANAKDDAERGKAREELRTAKEALTKAKKQRDEEIRKQQTEYAYWLAKPRVGNLGGLTGRKYQKAAEKFEASIKDSDEKKAKIAEKEEQIKDALAAFPGTNETDINARIEAAKNVLNKMESKDIKELPGKILKDVAVAKNLDENDLRALQKEGKLSKEDRAEIGKHLKAEAEGSGPLSSYLNKEGKAYWNITTSAPAPEVKTKAPENIKVKRSNDPQEYDVK